MEQQCHYYIPQLNNHNKNPGDRNVLSPSVLLAGEVPQAPLLLPVLLVNLRTLLLTSPHTMSHRKWKNQPDTDLGASSILTSVHTAGRWYVQCQRKTVGISRTQLETLRTKNDWLGKAWALAHSGKKDGVTNPFVIGFEACSTGENSYLARLWGRTCDLSGHRPWRRSHCHSALLTQY